MYSAETERLIQAARAMIAEERTPAMSNENGGSAVLSYKQAAVYLHVDIKTIRMYVYTGKLYAESQNNGRRGIRQSELDSYRARLEQHREEKTRGQSIFAT